MPFSNLVRMHTCSLIPRPNTMIHWSVNKASARAKLRVDHGSAKVQGESRIMSHLHHIATSDITYCRTHHIATSDIAYCWTSDQTQAKPGGKTKFLK